MMKQKTDKHDAEKGQPEAPRRPGRPSGVTNGAERREHLLMTALNLFASQGIQETSLTAIAHQAGVTSAMLHYYFRTREHLLDVLIDEHFIPVSSSVENIFEDNANDPIAAITQLAEKLIDISLENPWFAPMWVREFLSANGVLKQRLDERRGSHYKLIAQQRIADWQAQGRLNADIDPTLVIISLCGLTLLPIASAKRVVQIDGPVLKQHVMSLLINGLGVK
ncbi:TetR/AcrR family transcriptional regulator [Rouxiella sp. Mn2063]|uniref:TetR/AcrR family transcriptional regulator n=1 Tax=Rouxiella sp. Mn2063 TaxID=3395262 RepID=UPI003BD5EAEC